ncbi:hypothetical protein FSP39_023813 [Pinctada imbricata]|uniref:hydroxymethylbilane synthase n=1 Tax=Pinctada imbricata TaxID=66713 RepID=A0AA89C5V7_PINIB|nr:hypothetical protein FSP39_023813 [Pinctada imbricata]
MCECPVRSRTVKVGSGSTELAKIHTSLIVSALKESHPDVEFEVVTTDSLQDKLSKASNLQTVPKRKSDLALLLGEVDCVVSSLKDVPIKLHQGLVIGCVFKRESPYDVVVLHPKYNGQSLENLPNGSVIGTSSLRRSAQLSGRYTHLKFETIKGSLNDRFRKLDEDDSYAGLILAEAGLVRMGWQHRISEVRLPRDICMYALCQGAIGVKCREQDSEIINMLQPINDKEAALQCVAERSFFKNGVQNSFCKTLFVLQERCI